MSALRKLAAEAVALASVQSAEAMDPYLRLARFKRSSNASV